MVVKGANGYLAKRVFEITFVESSVTTQAGDDVNSIVQGLVLERAVVLWDTIVNGGTAGKERSWIRRQPINSPFCFLGTAPSGEQAKCDRKSVISPMRPNRSSSAMLEVMPVGISSAEEWLELFRQRGGPSYPMRAPCVAMPTMFCTKRGSGYPARRRCHMCGTSVETGR